MLDSEQWSEGRMLEAFEQRWARVERVAGFRPLAGGRLSSGGPGRAGVRAENLLRPLS